MAKRATTATCCLTLPLVLEKWQMDRLEKRFEIARQIYNTLVSFELKKLRRLEQTAEYVSIQNNIRQALDDPKQDSSQIRALYNQLNNLRQKAGF